MVAYMYICIQTMCSVFNVVCNAENIAYDLVSGGQVVLSTGQAWQSGGQ